MDWRPLAREEIRRFRQHGFLRLEHFAPVAEVEAVASIYDRLFRSRAGWSEGNYFDMAEAETEAHPYVAPQLLQLSRYAPELRFLPIFKRSWALARQILGPTSKLDLDHGFSSRPKAQRRPPGIRTRPSGTGATITTACRSGSRCSPWTSPRAACSSSRGAIAAR